MPNQHREGYVNVTAWIPREDRDAAATRARDEGSSLSRIIRDAVREYGKGK